jgi:fatty acyl-CoA reductase
MNKKNNQIPSQIIPFLEAQTFFVTGVTGFLGKVLLYKLLTTCPNIKDKSIYVLVRGKKELSAENRFEQDILSTSLLFAPGTLAGELARQKN